MISIKSDSKFKDKIRFVINDSQNPYPHMHAEIEMIYLLHGNANITGPCGCYALAEEDFIVLNPYELHSVAHEPDAQLLSLYISSDIVELLYEKPACFSIRCVSTEKTENTHLYGTVRQLLAQIFYRYTQSNEMERYRLWGDCMQLIELWTQAFSAEIKTDAAPLEGQHRVLRVVQYMTANYAESLTLEDMAQREFITPGYLSKLFRQCTGCTFLQYLNMLRLSHAWNDLPRGDLSITDIAMRSGFRSTNRFIQLFREQFGQTPGQYRYQLKNQLPQENVPPFLRTAVFQPLLRHRRGETSVLNAVLGKRCETENYIAALASPTVPLPHTWNRILNIGMAVDALFGPVQQQIRCAQAEIGFSHIRLAGIMNDNLVIFRLEGDTLSCNFVYLDMLLDFCLSLNLKPFIEFSYMPATLTAHMRAQLGGNGFIGPPKDYNIWSKLVRQIVLHLKERYGAAELAGWLFSPMRSTYQMGDLLSAEDYVKMYGILYNILKREHHLPFCGLGNDLDMIFYRDCAFLRTFLNYCSEHNCFPDYLTVQSYNCMYEAGNIDTFLLQSMETFPLSDDPDYLKHRMQALSKRLKQLGAPDIPIILEDWGFSQWQRDPRNDTAYKASFTIKNVMDSIGVFCSMASLKLTDLMEETPSKLRMFHGGPGMLTVNGLPKSGYFAAQFLGKLGNEIVLKTEDLIVTRRGESVQILLFRYTHSTNLSNQYYLLDDNPYSAFVPRLPKQFNLEISGFSDGEYLEEFFSISPQHGNSYDAWLRMGAPEPLTAWQREHLCQIAQPEYKTCTEVIHHTFRFTTTLSAHEVQLILITPK